jgi:hypothetical protein
MPCNRTGRDQRDSVEGLDFELTLLAGRSPPGPCLLLRGVPGIGKTSLLAAVQAGTAGMLVLRASGVQSEAEISFSALRELPVALTDRQRAGQDPRPAFLPLSGRLEAAFAPAIDSLPTPARHLLLLATLEPGASVAVLLPTA